MVGTYRRNNVYQYSLLLPSVSCKLVQVLTGREWGSQIQGLRSIPGDSDYKSFLPTSVVLRTTFVSILLMMAPTSTQNFDATLSAPASGVVAKLEAGIYVPTVAFFKDDEEVDVETTRRHALRLTSSGIKGIGQDIDVQRTQHVLTLHSLSW